MLTAVKYRPFGEIKLENSFRKQRIRLIIVGPSMKGKLVRFYMKMGYLLISL